MFDLVFHGVREPELAFPPPALESALPLNRPAQALTPGPRGVSDARRWAAQVLTEIDRAELVEAASISVSEVITNALLHAEQPVSVRLRGTREHPRIEVRDGSRQPPDLPDLDGNPEDDVLLTFGRGLSIVARVSSAWGADIDEEGKTVWFVPRVELAEGRGVQGIITELQPLQREDPPLVDDPVEVTLIGLPLPEMKSNGMHLRELRRELRLLAMGHEATTRWPPPSRGSSPSSTRRSGVACATSGSPLPCSPMMTSST